MKYLLAIFIFSLSVSFGFASPGSNNKKDCVICHISWGELSTNSLYSHNTTHLTIDGKEAYVSNAAMCYSCHDGYISESRTYFIENDYHSLVDEFKKDELGGLPLDNLNNIYCGTCHTPHANEMTETVNFSPFLRQEIKDSQMCMSCHTDENKMHLNHPIHVKQPNMPDGLFNKNLPSDMVECLSCHNLHHSQPTKIIVQENSDKLCEQCHQDKFEIMYSDHDFSQNSDHISNRNGTCSGCHLSHNGQSNYMWFSQLDSPETRNAFCIECHKTTDKKFQHTGHPVDGIISNISSIKLGIESGDSLNCISCHDPHNWSHTVDKLTAINEEGTPLNSFLKLPDDHDGALCVECHNDQKQITFSDHSVIRDGFKQLPTLLKTTDGQCTICHSTHDDGFTLTRNMITPYSQTTSLCLECHTNHSLNSSIGDNSHPIGIELTQQNSHLNSSDSTVVMGCETCHDPHIWGEHIEINNRKDLLGTPLTSFLKTPVSSNSELCISCHPDYQSIIGTDHDLTISHPNKANNPCFGCHEIHNSPHKNGLLNTPVNSNNNSIDNHCMSCHNSKGIANNKTPKYLIHPTIENPINKKIGLEAITPDENSINCKTCHNPHSWSIDQNLNTVDHFIQEGNYKTSFLHRKSTDLDCKKCHGFNTVVKYLYYHDDRSRTNQ